MESSFVYRVIRRSNFNRLVLSLIGIAILIAVGVAALRYLYNFVAGPFVLDRDQILSASDANDLNEYYVTIAGEEAFDTGYEYYTQYDDGREVTDSYFIGLWLDDRVLLIESTELNLVDEYTGALVPMSDEIKREVIQDIEREFPEARGIFLPFMLDTKDFRTNGFIGIGIGAVVLVVCLWLGWTAANRFDDPNKHPILRDITRFGDPEMVLHQIESELTLGADTAGSMKATRSWLIYATSSSLFVTRHKDVMWLYKSVTQHRTYGISTGKTFTAILWDRYGKSVTISGKEKEVNASLKLVEHHSPWAIMGYSDSIRDTWKSQREGFIGEVDRRYAQMK